MKNTSTLTRTASRPERVSSTRYIDVGGTNIRYIEMGRDNPGPVLVMLHGYRAGGDYWYPHTLPGMASVFHVIAPDLPGFGYSALMPDMTLAGYADKVNAFLDALGLDRIYLLGHSMGGQVAVAVAARRPERVLKLVLIASSGLPRSGPAWRAPLQMLTDMSMRHIRLIPVIMKLGFMSKGNREGLDMIRHESITGHLKQLTMPALIVWGSRDRIVPLEHGSLLARRIENGRLAVIRGAGHMPFYQKSDEFNRLVLNFLRQPQPE